MLRNNKKEKAKKLLGKAFATTARSLTSKKVPAVGTQNQYQLATTLLDLTSPFVKEWPLNIKQKCPSPRRPR